MNPNNCLTCDYKHRGNGGHCYMFRDAPTSTCYQHTGRASSTAAIFGAGASDSLSVLDFAAVIVDIVDCASSFGD